MELFLIFRYNILLYLKLLVSLDDEYNRLIFFFEGDEIIESI